ncbi:MAG TPA: HD domain-containing phosphohydrolase [Solirubrobacteraceae bacterium]|nr:HD domain-containing phosphohydrolase [Solirubrobacteraceae bacterium]
MSVESASAFAQARILVVDDEPANVLLLEELLKLWGYESVLSTTDSSQVAVLLEHEHPDLLLLDLTMPHPDGFEVMRMLCDPSTTRPRCPVLVLTADVSPATRERALACGASDFLIKPFDQTEVRLRVRNLLSTRLLQLDLERSNELLEQRVQGRTRDLEDARRETLERLALAGEYRSDETQEHAQRVGRTAALLAAELGYSQDDVELIRRAAPLHDIGKLGVPDAILLKPGRLTSDEFETMKRHTLIGPRILAGSVSAVLRAGEVIAGSHHERWDGGGYPSGLAGEAIPLAGRLVALADVFDALTHARPYKPAWSSEHALAEIHRGAGSQFDPRIVDAFDRIVAGSLIAPSERIEVAVSADV